MSRSYAKKPVDNYVCYRSNKSARSSANRCLRAAVRNFNEDTEVFPLLREVSNVYDFPSDGLPHWQDEDEHNQYLTCIDTLKGAINAGCSFSEFTYWKNVGHPVLWKSLHLNSDGYAWMLEEVLDKFHLPFSEEGLEQITSEMVAKWAHDYSMKRWAR
jgi:hypothetical protein